MRGENRTDEEIEVSAAEVKADEDPVVGNIETLAEFLASYETPETSDEVSGDYKSLAQRLLGSMQYGFRIEIDSGHRWIIMDTECDNFPPVLKERFGANRSPEEYQHYMQKEYGSVTKALDTIDDLLREAGEVSTLENYLSFLPHGDDILYPVFGTGPVE